MLADEIDTVTPAIAEKAFPKILGRFALATCASSVQRQRLKASAGCGTPLAQKRHNSAKIASSLGCARQIIHYLPQDFIERLQANYDPSLLQAYLEGQFCNLTTGQVYDRFDRAKHVITNIPDVSREPLRVGCDFNVGNSNAVIGVRLGEKLLLIDEISGAHDTDAMAQEIQRRADGRPVYIYPDASGGNRSTNASRTDIQILESYGFSNQSPKANPPIRDRVASVQALLENGKGQGKASGCCQLQAHD